MSKYNKSVLTDAGMDLAKRANAGKAKFVITRTASTAEDLSKKTTDELEKLTDLPSIAQWGKIQDTEGVESDNTVLGVSLRYDNQDLKKGYPINAVGIYVKEEGKDKDFLYAITTADQPDYMPDFSDQVLYRFNLQMFLVVGRAATVNVLVDDDTAVSMNKFNKHVAEADKKLSEKVSSISVNDGPVVKPDANGLAKITVPDPDLSKIALRITDVSNGSGTEPEQLIGMKRAEDGESYYLDLNSDTSLLQEFNALIQWFVNSRPLEQQQLQEGVNQSLQYLTEQFDQLVNELGTELKPLQGTQSIDKPNFNSLTKTGIYYVTNPNNGQNYPTGNWGVLFVLNGNNQRIQQMYYADNGTDVYARQAIGSAWKPWTNLKSTTTYTNGDIDNKTRGTVVTGYNLSNKQATKVTASFNDKWLVDQAALATFADAINDLKNRQTQTTQSITNLTTKVDNGLVHVFNTLAEATAVSKQHPDWVCASTEG